MFLLSKTTPILGPGHRQAKLGGLPSNDDPDSCKVNLSSNGCWLLKFNFDQIFFQHLVVQFQLIRFSRFFKNHFSFSLLVILIGERKKNLKCTKSFTMFHLFNNVFIFILSPTGKDQVNFSIWHKACCNIDAIISIMIISYSVIIM